MKTAADTILENHAPAVSTLFYCASCQKDHPVAVRKFKLSTTGGVTRKLPRCPYCYEMANSAK